MLCTADMCCRNGCACSPRHAVLPASKAVLSRPRPTSGVSILLLACFCFCQIVLTFRNFCILCSEVSLFFLLSATRSILLGGSHGCCMGSRPRRCLTFNVGKMSWTVIVWGYGFFGCCSGFGVNVIHMQHVCSIELCKSHVRESQSKKNSSRLY